MEKAGRKNTRCVEPSGSHPSDGRGMTGAGVQLGGLLLYLVPSADTLPIVAKSLFSCWDNFRGAALLPASIHDSLSSGSRILGFNHRMSSATPPLGNTPSIGPIRHPNSRDDLPWD
jgi:hypothetical protein